MNCLRKKNGLLLIILRLLMYHPSIRISVSFLFDTRNFKCMILCILCFAYPTLFNSCIPFYSWLEKN